MENYIDHRKRVKDRFRKEGLDHFDERYVLELMLFYCVPRKDTRELALRLLDHFGSIVQVLDATPEELERVPGVGEGISTFIAFRRELERYYRIKADDNPIEPLISPEDFERSLRAKFIGQRNEVVYVLCLDAKCKLLSCLFVGEGSVNSAGISVRKIVETALHANATSVVLAHNHPSGLALPSEEDLQTTRRIAAGLQAVEIQLVDHIIVADDDYVSMAQSGQRFLDCFVT